MDQNNTEKLKKGNKYKRLLSNTAVLGIGVFASKFLVFLMMPFYTRVLSPGEYGSADLISQTANLLIPLACVGITDGIFRFAMDKDGDKRQVLSSGLFVLLLSSILFCLLSPLIGLADYFRSYVLLIVAYVLSANLHSVCAQYMRACGRTKLFAFQGILNTALVIGLNIFFLVALRMGIVGYVLSVVVSDFVISLLLIFSFGLYKQIGARFVDKELIKKLLKYSIPMIPATVFWWITSVSDRYMVTYFCGDAVNGLYTAAYKIPTLLTLLSTVFMEAWQYSAVTEDDGAEEGTVRVNFFSKVFNSYQALVFTACSAIVALSQVFITVLCAESYFEAWRFIPVLTLSAVFSGLTSFLGSVYLLKKKSILTLLTSMAGAATNLVLNLFLIPSMGAQGAGVATLASYFIVFVIRAVNTKKYLSFSTHTPRIIINVILISAQTVLLLLLPEYIILTQALAFGAVIAVNILPLWSEVKGIIGALLKKMKKQ